MWTAEEGLDGRDLPELDASLEAALLPGRDDSLSPPLRLDESLPSGERLGEGLRFFLEACPCADGDGNGSDGDINGSAEKSESSISPVIVDGVISVEELRDTSIDRRELTKHAQHPHQSHDDRTQSKFDGGEKSPADW